MAGTALSRNHFLKFLAASPLASLAQSGPSPVIASVADALNVFDFEAAARQRVPPAHFGYIATGVDDDRTVRANRDGFQRYQIRSRRLVDVSKTDTSIELLGTRWETPIALAPAASQRAFHPEGEIAVARAARARKHLQILSTVATASIEEVNATRGEPVWFQHYPSSEWKVSHHMIQRAERAGCPVIVVTVDQIRGTNRETLRRYELQDPRTCTDCHDRTNLQTRQRRKPMFDGLDLSGLTLQPPMTWEDIRRIRDVTRMKLIIKGLVVREDAALAVASGADAIICSNHGGRADETGRASIESLVEVLEGAAGKIPVMVDGGFRRGTDIFTALSLGAAAICIGRPYLWGLGAFGQEGVEAVLEILTRELHLAMRYAGTPSIKHITRAYVTGQSR
jgi:4-hydroxymandelate oxidase